MILTFRHFTEGRVTVAVGTEDEGLPLGTGSEVDQLKLVQGTLELLVELEAAILLRHVVGLITRGTKQPLGLCLHQFHVAPTLATSGAKGSCLLSAMNRVIPLLWKIPPPPCDRRNRGAGGLPFVGENMTKRKRKRRKFLDKTRQSQKEKSTIAERRRVKTK
jgi:hypothetical protein